MYKIDDDIYSKQVKLVLGELHATLLLSLHLQTQLPPSKSNSDIIAVLQIACIESRSVDGI